MIARRIPIRVRTKIESSAKSLLAPWGKFKLRQMMKNGFPQHLYPPLLYLVTRRLRKKESLLVQRIEALREASMTEGNAFQIVRESGASAGIAEATFVNRDFKWLRNISSVSEYWGAFLHACANAVQAQTILELGCCMGISGSYLATAESCEEFITIEGSKDLIPIAESNLRMMVNRFRIIPALFDEALDAFLPSLSKKLDLVHIDGDHTEENTLRYFKRLLPHLRHGSLVLFDDIHFSAGMWNAWEKLSRWKGAEYSINVGRYGILVWHGGDREPEAFDLSLFASEWGRGDAASGQS